jgi:hypothetical protein
MLSQTPAVELRVFLRRLPLALAGAVVLWALARPVYTPVLCAATQFLARLFEVPPASAVVLQGGDALLGRTDLRADSGWLKFPLTQIHFNLVPFLALVLALPRPLAAGRWRRLLVALAVLAAAHVLSLLWQLKFLEAFSMGPWSRANYSDLARDVYGTLRYFFDIPVTFALPFLLWLGSYSDRVLALVGLEAPAKR